MGKFGKFETTTPRSSHVGQPGYDTREDWQRFLEKYRERILQFGRDHYPHRVDMVEDVFQDLLVKILSNPFVLSYEPTVRFRSVLIRLYREAFADAVRKLKISSRENYERNTAPLREESVTQDCDRRRLQLLTIDMIRQNLLAPDYPNGRFSREIKSLDLKVWRALQEEGATYAKIARQFRLTVWKVYSANRRVNTRIERDAVALLAAEGVL